MESSLDDWNLGQRVVINRAHQAQELISRKLSDAVVLPTSRLIF
jgi:hypothetical protein